MKDCWVSPYGEVVYIEENGIWLHAKKAAEILNGKKVEDMEIECLNDTKLTLNGEVAKKLSIEISTDLLKTAEIIGE